MEYATELPPRVVVRRTLHPVVPVERVAVLLFAGDVEALLLACVLVSATDVMGLMVIGGVLAVHRANGLYKSRLTLSLVDDLPILVEGVVAICAVTALVVFQFRELPAKKIVAICVVALVLLVLARALIYAFVRLARRRGWVAHRTLILGTGPTARRVAQIIDEHPEHGLRVVGFVGPRLDGPRCVTSGFLDRSPARLSQLIAQNHVDDVIMTDVDDGTPAVLESLRLRDPGTHYTLYLVPPLFQLLHEPRGERLRDIALIRLRPAVSELLAWRTKRALDIVVSALALLLLSPVLVLIALAVRMELHGAVLFRQTRVGQYGRLFTLYKFQSLTPGDPDESATFWSVRGDARIKPVGRFIRRTSLDELPQLFNILRGDMSLVGPRPERPHFVLQFNKEHDSYGMRHRVRPGLTGWAAVHGLRGNTSIEERAYFDNVYIDNWSLWLDIKIIAMTFVAVVRG